MTSELKIAIRRGALTLAFIPSAIGLATALPAAATAPGIYSVGGSLNRGNREGIADRLSEDGSTAFSSPAYGRYISTIEGGPLNAPHSPTVFELPADAAGFSAMDLSRDGSLFLGYYNYRPSQVGGYRGMVIRSIDGSVSIPVEGPSEYASELSPNAQWVTGTRTEFVTLTSFSADPFRWSAGTGRESLPFPTGFEDAEALWITDDGMAYGHALTAVHTRPGRLEFRRDAAIRWLPSGEIETLSGTDSTGNAWSLIHAFDVSPDGAYRFGYGQVEDGEDPSGSPIWRDVQGVFSDDGLEWFLREEGYPDRYGWANEWASVSGDGSIVVGNRYDVTGGLFQGPRVPTVWQRDGERFYLETYLQLAGLDTTGWTFETLYDVSEDGTHFLGIGTREGSDEYIFIAVIPEPSTALLIGFGLTVLAATRRSSSSPP